MSAITTIFDSISSLLATTYPSHLLLVNPWELDLNDNLLLNQGVGFYFGSGINTNRVLDCKLSISREIIIRLTRVQRGTDRDITIRQSTEKLLLEDQKTLISSLEADPTINNLVSKLVWDSDGGIEFVYPDRISYLYIESRFTMEYLEAF